MNNTFGTADDNLMLLRQLIDLDQQERREIQTELHTRKSDLAYIHFVLHRIEKDANEGKFDTAKVDEIKKVVHRFFEDLAPIMQQIFDPLIKLGGLNASISRIVPYYNERYSTHVEISSDLDETITVVDSLTCVAVYKICFHSVHYLCLHGYKEVAVHIGTNRTQLIVDILGRSRNQITTKDDEVLACVNLIKANVVWKKAEILPQTNWRDYFRIVLTLEN